MYGGIGGYSDYRKDSNNMSGKNSANSRGRDRGEQGGSRPCSRSSTSAAGKPRSGPKATGSARQQKQSNPSTPAKKPKQTGNLKAEAVSHTPEAIRVEEIMRHLRSVIDHENSSVEKITPGVLNMPVHALKGKQVLPVLYAVLCVEYNNATWKHEEVVESVLAKMECYTSSVRRRIQPSKLCSATSGETQGDDDFHDDAASVMSDTSNEGWKKVETKKKTKRKGSQQHDESDQQETYGKGMKTGVDNDTEDVKHNSDESEEVAANENNTAVKKEGHPQKKENLGTGDDKREVAKAEEVKTRSDATENRNCKGTKDRNGENETNTGSHEDESSEINSSEEQSGDADGQQTRVGRGEEGKFNNETDKDVAEEETAQASRVQEEVCNGENQSWVTSQDNLHKRRDETQTLDKSKLDQQQYSEEIQRLTEQHQQELISLRDKLKAQKTKFEQYLQEYQNGEESRTAQQVALQLKEIQNQCAHEIAILKEEHKQENKTLLDQLEEQDTRFKEYKQDEGNRTEQQIEIKMRKIQKQYADEIARLKEEHQQERKALLDQLARDMARKIAENEHDLEDITRSNRPMKVAEEYQSFCSDHWLTAKTNMDEMDEDATSCDENIKLVVLTGLLQGAYRYCRSAKNAHLKETMQGILTLVGEEDRVVKWSEFQQDHPKLASAICIRVRDHLQPPDVTEKALEDIYNFAVVGLHDPVFVNSKMLKKLSKKKWKQLLQTYISGAISLTWRMVTQTPPMALDCEGVGVAYQGDKVQDVFWGSGNPKDPSNVVIIYVYPTLYHGSHMMVKGKVICGPINWAKEAQDQDGHFPSV